MDNEDWDGADRRQSGGAMPWLDGMPQWARILALIGLPTVGFVVMLWLLIVKQPEIKADHVAMLAEQKYARDRSDASAVKQDQIYRLLQRICTNTAKSDIERQRCFDN